MSKFSSYEIWVRDVKEDTCLTIDLAIDKAKKLSKEFGERNVQIIPKGRISNV